MKQNIKRDTWKKICDLATFAEICKQRWINDPHHGTPPDGGLKELNSELYFKLDYLKPFFGVGINGYYYQRTLYQIQKMYGMYGKTLPLADQVLNEVLDEIQQLYVDELI